VSIAEIKASIDRMTDEERFFAAAYLQHRAQAADPAYQALLSERMKRLEAGQKVTLEQAQRIHEALEGEGL
jgi:ribosomal protein L9